MRRLLFWLIVVNILFVIFNGVIFVFGGQHWYSFVALLINVFAATVCWFVRDA